jgi:hypothetical protein
VRACESGVWVRGVHGGMWLLRWWSVLESGCGLDSEREGLEFVRARSLACQRMVVTTHSCLPPPLVPFLPALQPGPSLLNASAALNAPRWRPQAEDLIHPRAMPCARNGYYQLQLNVWVRNKSAAASRLAWSHGWAMRTALWLARG